jgi:hypothetical protein
MRQQGGPGATADPVLGNASTRQRVQAALGFETTCGGRSRKAVTPLVLAASCSRRLWKSVSRSTSANAPVRTGLRKLSSSAQRRAALARTTIRRGIETELQEPGPVEIGSGTDPQHVAIRCQPAEQGCGEARGCGMLRRATQFVQGAASQAATRQRPLDAGQRQGQDALCDRPIGAVEPGQSGTQPL